jgi:hypothetical protein
MVDGQAFHIIIWQSQDGEVFNTWSMALSHHFTHNGRRSGFPYYNLTAPGRSVKYDKWHHCDLDFDFKVKEAIFLYFGCSLDPNIFDGLYKPNFIWSIYDRVHEMQIIWIQTGKYSAHNVFSLVQKMYYFCATYP